MIDIFGRTITLTRNADGSVTGVANDGTTYSVSNSRGSVLVQFNSNPPAGWVWPAAASPSADEIGAGVDAMLDALAISWGYQSSISIATYLASSNAVFKAQAVAFCAYRDAVWSQVYSDMAALQAGTKQLPATVAAYIATLPAPPAEPTS
jgi:hypothetical protein